MLLSFEKPQKIRSTEEHNNMFSSDSGVAGTYVPNMSDEDRKRWKGKHIKGEDERIEIRKSLNGVQLLIVIYKNIRHVDWNYNNQSEYHKNHQNVHISMNGKLQMTFAEYEEMKIVIEEAKQILN